VFHRCSWRALQVLNSLTDISVCLVTVLVALHSVHFAQWRADMATNQPMATTWP